MGVRWTNLISVTEKWVSFLNRLTQCPEQMNGKGLAQREMMVRESQKTAVILLPEMQKPNKQRKNSVNILFLLFTTSLRCRNKHLNTVCGGL